MRLLQRCSDGTFNLTVDYSSDNAVPPYAILSHTWGADADEVTFEDLSMGTGKAKPGYTKIRFCGEQAQQDGLQYFWIDTCCINKENKAELAHAIKSMFRWYRDAARCYVYMSDVSGPRSSADKEACPPPWRAEFRKSRWFTRGWTLQELLAPRSVEFFSRDMKKLGDKTSLAQQIHEITGIPHLALHGAPLSQFTVEERLSWKEHRSTTRQEDGAYSMLGIFDVYIAPLYGEGSEGAFRRLLEEIRKLRECIRDIRITDPRDDKKRIEDTKGGLLQGSYRWILDNTSFQQWLEDPQSRLLWVKGDPGKGKTMLLCGIIDELRKSSPALLSFFFCQDTNSHINNATAVLRGLIYLLVSQQPSLAAHLRTKHDQAGRSAFEDANSWIVLLDIFTNMIADPDLRMAYFVVDALDECVADLPKLLDLVIQTSASTARIKWLLSSRNEMHIEQKLRCVDDKARLDLELKQNAKQVSRAVDTFIDDKLSRLASLQDEGLREQVRDILRRKANGTFLWVALVVQELEGPESWEPLQVVEEVPSGLHQLYNRMMNQIQQLKERNSKRCKLLLSTACTAYRPLFLSEMGSLCALEGQVSIRTIVTMCGSFLTVRDDQIYLVHQSAKDYLSDKTSRGDAHYNMFSQSLRLMSSVLKRDMYNLDAPGFPVDEVRVPTNDPLATARYSCIYWADHLNDAILSKSTDCVDSLQDDGIVFIFLKERCLYWLEALSLCNSIPAGVKSMTKLQELVQGEENTTKLAQLINDTCRFIMYHKVAIENYPLQTYASALLFSPSGSLIKESFQQEAPSGFTTKAAMGENWSPCLLTLEGHSDRVTSVDFSHNSAWLASSSYDRKIKIWDASSGMCLRTLDGHSDVVTSVVFSHDSAWLASASWDKTIKIWDTSRGICLRTLKGHSEVVTSVAFSDDSRWLASASDDATVRIWSASTGISRWALWGHRSEVRSLAFSHDSTRLASGEEVGIVKIWDISNGSCLQTFKGHSGPVTSTVFSHDSAWLVSVSRYENIKIWDFSSGTCLQAFGDDHRPIMSTALSHDSTHLASALSDYTVRIWDTRNCVCLRTLWGHGGEVSSVVFSHDSARVASASNDGTVKIWDASSAVSPQSPKWHSHPVILVASSQDCTRLASASDDGTIKVWDASNGSCLQTLEGHDMTADLIAFSHDSTWLASVSSDEVKIWDIKSGACLQTLNGHSRPLSSIAVSPWPTKKLASASWDHTINIWDVSRGSCTHTPQINHQVSSMAFPHDAAQLALGMRDGVVMIWNLRRDRPVRTLVDHRQTVRLLAFSCNSTWLASASDDNIVNIWNAKAGVLHRTLDVGTSLSYISFNLSNTSLFTDFGTIDIGDLSDIRQTMYAEPQRPRYHGLGLSADGVWITHNSKNMLWLPSELRPVCSVASGNRISIGAGNRLWICTFTPF